MSGLFAGGAISQHSMAFPAQDSRMAKGTLNLEVLDKTLYTVAGTRDTAMFPSLIASLD